MFHEVLFDRLCSLFLCSQAGSSIPSVSLFVVNLYGPAHTLEMMPPDSLRARYYISVNVKKTRINLDDFRHHLPEMIAHPDFFSPSLPLSLSLSLSFLHNFPISSFFSSPCIIFCIASSETATSPWWLGLAAPASRFVGWIEPRTNRCCACARPPRGHAPRWAVISRSALVIRADPAAVRGS